MGEVSLRALGKRFARFSSFASQMRKLVIDAPMISAAWRIVYIFSSFFLVITSATLAKSYDPIKRDYKSPYIFLSSRKIYIPIHFSLDYKYIGMYIYLIAAMIFDNEARSSQADVEGKTRKAATGARRERARCSPADNTHTKLSP